MSEGEELSPFLYRDVCIPFIHDACKAGEKCPRLHLWGRSAGNARILGRAQLPYTVRAVPPKILVRVCPQDTLKCQQKSKCFYRHTDTVDTLGNRLFAHISSIESYSPPPQAVPSSPIPSRTSAPARSQRQARATMQDRTQSEAGLKRAAGRPILTCSSTMPTSDRNSTVMNLPATQPMAIGVRPEVHLSPNNRSSPLVVLTTPSAPGDLLMQACKRSLKLIERILERPTIVAALTYAISCLRENKGYPRFHYGPLESTKWQLLLLCAVSRAFCVAFQPRLYAHLAIRSKNDVHVFLRQHPMPAVEHVRLSGTPCSALASFVHSSRRHLVVVDIALPASYTTDARLKVLTALGDTTSPRLKQLRLRNVGRRLSVEAISQILTSNRSLHTLDLEHLVLPSLGSPFLQISHVDLAPLRVLRLRWPHGPGSSTDRHALERFLTPFAVHLEQLGLFDLDAADLAWPESLPFPSLWRLELVGVSSGGESAVVGEDDYVEDEGENGAEAGATGTLTPATVLAGVQAARYGGLKRIVVDDSGPSWDAESTAVQRVIEALGAEGAEVVFA